MRGRRRTVKRAVRQQYSRNLGARVIKYLAADNNAPKQRFAGLPESSQQTKTDANGLPPTITQSEHSKRSECESKSISIRKILVAPYPHHACRDTLISAACANTMPWDGFNDEIVGQKYCSMRPAIMLIREPSRFLYAGNRAAHVPGRDIAIKDQITWAACAKIRNVTKRTNVAGKNADGYIANAANRARINSLLRQSTPPALKIDCRGANPTRSS
jgi:hypothetical protein